MSLLYRRLRLLAILVVVSIQPLAAEPEAFTREDKTRWLLGMLRNATLHASESTAEARHDALNIKIQGCARYPYDEAEKPAAGAHILLEDLYDGLQTGLHCLSGLRPRGPMHPYHHEQARRLVDLMTSPQQKTFQCVEDAMFATAVATSPLGPNQEDAVLPQLRLVDHPGVVVDTYRLGGYLSRRHDDQTYRTFFRLNDAQIFEHRNAKPLRAKGLHRYKNRPGLLFHEVIHWLGHEHSAGQPDLANLYETCCFGGSDYISDPSRNRAYQQKACSILSDEEVWNQSGNPDQQMQIWHYKGYDKLKSAMRADYDS